MNPLTVGSPEAIAHSTGVSGFAAAQTVIVCWVFGLYHVSVPVNVALAFTVALAALISFALRFIPQPAQGTAQPGK